MTSCISLVTRGARGEERIDDTSRPSFPISTALRILGSSFNDLINQFSNDMNRFTITIYPISYCYDIWGFKQTHPYVSLIGLCFLLFWKLSERYKFDTCIPMNFSRLTQVFKIEFLTLLGTWVWTPVAISVWKPSQYPHFTVLADLSIATTITMCRDINKSI
jgi:hypothetical protein